MMIVRIAGRSYQVDWAHLLVATLILSACITYLIDARSTSLKIQNLIMVQPAAIIALILYGLILPQCIRRVPDGPAQAAKTAAESTSRHRLTPVEFLRVASLAVAFGFFVFAMEPLGFDVSAWLFITVGLFICGERRLLVLTLLPLLFTILVVLGYKKLIPYPFHTLFF